VLEVIVGLDAPYLVLDDLFGFGFDAVVVLLYHLFHPIHSGIIDEIGDDWDFFVGFGIGGDTTVHEPKKATD
jgi:hypothetical protein